MICLLGTVGPENNGRTRGKEPGKLSMPCSLALSLFSLLLFLFLLLLLLGCFFLTQNHGCKNNITNTKLNSGTWPVDRVFSPRERIAAKYNGACI